jgi:hypothetical protein
MLPTPPPVRQPIARVTLGEIIAREAEQLPDLEQPSARDVGLMLKRIEDAIGQHLVELVRGTNARAEQLQHDVRHPRAGCAGGAGPPGGQPRLPGAAVGRSRRPTRNDRDAAPGAAAWPGRDPDREARGVS